MGRNSRTFWLVVLCAGTILAINMGVRQSFGLYLRPMSLELGLGREIFGLSFGLMNLLWGMAAPFTGAVADKFGVARVVTFGALLYAIGVMLMANAASGGDLLASGVLIGVAISCTGFTAVLGAVGRAASEERRGMALGLASMGSSIGQFAAMPYAHVLIEGLGWAPSLMVLAATAAIMAPLGWAIAGRPLVAADQAPQSLKAAFSEAMQHRGFQLLTAGFFVCGFHIAFVATHLPAYLADHDFPPETGVLALMVIGLGNIVGTYCCGRAGEIMEQRQALAALYFARALVFLGFLVIPLSQTSVVLFAALLGFLWLGTVPLTSGLIATLFGPRWLSMLFGVVFLSHQIGGFLGAWLGGFLYDRFQSYEAMWWLSIALGLMSALLHWPIKERPVPRLAMEHR